MSRTRRVVFELDESTLRALEDMTKQGGFGSLAETMRQSLQISQALQSQAGQGFTEVMVRKPETSQERVINTPTLINSDGKTRT